MTPTEQTIPTSRLAKISANDAGVSFLLSTHIDVFLVGSEKLGSKRSQIGA